MRVIHGIWAHGALCLWAEDQALPPHGPEPAEPPGGRLSRAARGRVLPVIAAEDGAYAARWRPVLGSADAQRARDLAAAMPPSCRAESGEPPGALLAAVLDCLADAAARTRLPASVLPARRGRTPARIPWPERYVVALTTTDARLEVETPQDEVEVAELAAGLDAWLDGARIPAGPVRTCFRLTEPLEPGGRSSESAEPDADPWRVEFALQSAEDPSLLVPATDLWAGEGSDRLDGDLLAVALADADLVITSYCVATSDRGALSTVTWARVVCDETQTLDSRTMCWTMRSPASGLNPSLPCVSIPGQGCLACW